MNNIPKSFLSPLLAQAKLRFSGNKNSSGGSTPQCSIVAINSSNNTMTSNSNISEIPTFDIFCQLKEEERYSDIGLPISEAIEEKHSYRKHAYLEFLETRGLAR